MACPRCDGTGTYFTFGTCYRCSGSGTVAYRKSQPTRAADPATLPKYRVSVIGLDGFTRFTACTGTESDMVREAARTCYRPEQNARVELIQR